MGKAPCRPFTGLGASCGGVLVSPGLGERALDQAQDDLMGKKCPQEEQRLRLPSRLGLIRISSSLSPCWDAGGGPGSLAPPQGPDRRAGPRVTSLFFLCASLPLSVSHCLCIFISDSPISNHILPLGTSLYGRAPPLSSDSPQPWPQDLLTRMASWWPPGVTLVQE